MEHNPDMRFVVQLSWGSGDIDNQDFPKAAFDNVEKEKTPAQLKIYNERSVKAGKLRPTTSTRSMATAGRYLLSCRAFSLW